MLLPTPRRPSRGWWGVGGVGPTPRAAEERLDAARRLCAGGREIDNVVPKTLRAKPFSIRGMVGPCRAEPGNLRWDVWQDRDDPNRFVLDELYADDAAVAAGRRFAGADA